MKRTAKDDDKSVAESAAYEADESDAAGSSKERNARARTLEHSRTLVVKR